MRPLLTILIIFFLSSCISKKTAFTCGTYLIPEKEWIDSKITNLQTTGIADTTVAYVNGHVLGLRIQNDSTYLDTLAFTAIEFKHHQDTVSTGTVAQVHGVYNTTLDTGIYDIRINFVGYNTLTLENFKLGAGEIKELNVILGQGHGTTEYFITKNNSFVRRTKKKD